MHFSVPCMSAFDSRYVTVMDSHSLFVLHQCREQMFHTGMYL